MIRISQLKLPISHSREDLERKIQKSLPVKKAFTYEIVRQSLDARKKSEKKFVYTIDVAYNSRKSEQESIRRINHKNIMSTQRPEYHFPASGNQPLKFPPVVVGSGPAGLFCALALAKNGYCPLVIERGAPVSSRKEDVEKFWKTGILNPRSNVQFGEGGAGTFSDGKLNTLVKDPSGRIRAVLQMFVEAGAPSEILYQQKPHLGTDVLMGIVESIRRQIEASGGRFLFHTQVIDFLCEDNRISGLLLENGEKIPAQAVVCAIGHSARDTFETLYRRGFSMEAKAFAVGVRIEHPQEMINQALYGEKDNPLLGAASYKLTNTQLIATVSPHDYPDDTPLGGVAYQRQLEQKAWELAQGKIPVQLWQDFQQGKASIQLGQVAPSIKGAYQLSSLHSILPDAISAAIREGIPAFDKKIPGFARPDCLLSGIESRSSSPVRILRGTDMQSNIQGFYPCGEGAGYAGGITSAAVDGLKTAEAIAKNYMKIQ